MKTIMTPINTIWNFEVVRDYCGTFYWDAHDPDLDPHSERAYVYYIPTAIRVLVKDYHFFADDNSDNAVKTLDLLIASCLEKIIPLDSDKWDNGSIMCRVYNAVYVDNPLAEQLKVAAASVINSDYNKAKRFIKTIEDPEINVILDKAINGHKPSKANIDFRKMDEARKEAMKKAVNMVIK